jgi:hypothetical protein
MKSKRTKVTAMILAAAMVFAFIPQFSMAAVIYMPDVTKEMSSAGYWSDKMKEPDKILADNEKLSEIQKAIYDAKSTNTKDLTKPACELFNDVSEDDTFNGQAAGDALKSSALADAITAYSPAYWCRYDAAGNYISTQDEALNGYYKPMIDNCKDEDAKEVMHVRYAVCTTRSCITMFPSDQPLHDAPTDPDYDFRFLSTVRVNEPLIIKAESNDGKYYQATSSCVSGWIPAEDVAVCANRQEWLDAWDLDSDELLVVCDDKVRTEESNYQPETSNMLLPMGTCLALATEDEIKEMKINRSAHNNHVVWIPVRTDVAGGGTENPDGSIVSNYSKKIALIGENRKVSEGYLPLTSANLSQVTMNWLGDCYGWGGMLSSNDCSGYVRDVYKCFGLDLARNTTWQAEQPVKKYGLTGKSSEEKTEIIKKLPVGAVLIFNGHEMIYLGNEGDKLYVISSVSKLVMPDEINATRTRNVMINTLDVKRASGKTWLEDLDTANVPYLGPDDALPERKGEPSKPKAPKISIRADYSNRAVCVSWDEVDEADGYIVAYREAGSSKWTEKKTTKVDYTVKKLKNKGAYQFKAATVKKNTEVSDYSNVCRAYMFKMKCTLKPGKKSLKVKWKKDAKASGYFIRYSKKKSMKGAKTITISNSSRQSYKIKDLKKKTKYYVQIMPFRKVSGQMYPGEFSRKAAKKTK